MLGKKLGRKGLAAVATVASPETILRWYRELVAKKDDGSFRRGPGRPKKRGEILGMAVNPGGAWMERIARNLVDAFNGFLLGKRYALADRDPLYTEGFRENSKNRGVKVLRLPPKSHSVDGDVALARVGRVGAGRATPVAHRDVEFL